MAIDKAFKPVSIPSPHWDALSSEERQLLAKAFKNGRETFLQQLDSLNLAPHEIEISKVLTAVNKSPTIIEKTREDMRRWKEKPQAQHEELSPAEEEEERQEKIKTIKLSELENTPSQESVREIEKAKNEGRTPPPLKTLKDDPRYQEYKKTLTARIQAKRPSNQFLSSERQQALLQEANEELRHDFLQKHFDEKLENEYKFSNFSTEERSQQDDQAKRMQEYTSRRQKEEEDKNGNSRPSIKQTKQFVEKITPNQPLSAEHEQEKIHQQNLRKKIGNRIKNRFQRRQPIQKSTPELPKSLTNELYGEKLVPRSPLRQRFSRIRNATNRQFRGMSDHVRPQVNKLTQKGIQALGKGAGKAAGGLAKVGGRLAASAARAALMNPYVLTAIGIIILIILLVIIIIMIFTRASFDSNQSTDSANSISYTRVPCSDTPGTDIAADINKKFSIALTVNDQLTLDTTAPYATVAKTVQSKLYDDLCRLFGHVNGQTTNNTFGKIFTGQGAYTTVTTRTVLNIAFLSGDTTKDAAINKFPDCSIQDTVPATMRSTQPATMIWSFYKPDKCSDFQLEFTLAKALTDTLSKRAAIKKDPVYDDYVKTVFPTNEYTPDTVNNMYTNADPPTLFPNCSTNHNSNICFDNMVAWYMTWGTTNACMNTNSTGKNIIWLNSDAHGDSTAQFDPHPDWIYGACSQFSLATVLNAYGGKPGGGLWRIEEVATQSQQLGVWDNYFHSPSTGGTLHDAWVLEANHFNMNIDYQEVTPNDQSLGDVIDTANKGNPVIVNAPNHYLVIWGGDSTYVWTLDSSPHDFTWAPQSTTDSVHMDGPHHDYELKPATHPVTRAEFLKGLGNYANYWGGDKNGGYTGKAIRIVLTPKGLTSTNSSASATQNNTCQP